MGVGAAATDGAMYADKPPRPLIACLLGAGFSFTAGVPLASKLFDRNWVIAPSRASEKRFAVVREHYETWRNAHPDEHSEKYMAMVYTRNAGPNPPRWEWIVEYVGAVIASAGTPPASLNRNPRYSNRINRPLYCSVHRLFRDVLLRVTKEISVITTNYDIVVERVLRHRRMQRPPSPGCFYGGVSRPQILTGAPQPFSQWGPDRTIEMTGSIPVFKLHGSLNWALRGESILAYQDMRAAFRHGGDAAIIPPIPEKSVPDWLQAIWTNAEASLCSSDVWVMCGYSMPEYDTQILQLLERSGTGRPLTVLVVSPEADAIKEKLMKLLPLCTAIPLPGLPDGVEGLDQWLRSVAVGVA